MLSIKEAVATLERHDIKVSLLCNGLGFVRKVAELIQSFEKRLGNVVSTDTLKDGDILVMKTDDMPSYSEMDHFRDRLHEVTGGKKILIVCLPLDSSFEAMDERDKDTLRKHLERK